MRGRSAEEAHRPQPEGWALSLLADMLKSGAAAGLTEIIGCLEQIDNRQGIPGAGEDAPPEYEPQSWPRPATGGVYKFCYYFGQEYYPLPAEYGLPLARIGWSGMPVGTHGGCPIRLPRIADAPRISAIGCRLVIYPYAGDERDIDERYSWEMVRESRSLTWVQAHCRGGDSYRIPKDGWRGGGITPDYGRH